MSDHHDEREQTMFGLNRLAQAIEQLTCWLKTTQNAATKADLSRAKHEIILAIRASSPANDAAIVKATEDLKASNDALEDAVNKNK